MEAQYMSQPTQVYLRENILVPDSIIARRFKIPTHHVYNLRHILGIDKPRHKKGEKWQEFEIDFLKENPDIPNELISLALERSVEAIYVRKVKLKIKPNGSRGDKYYLTKSEKYDHH